MEIKKDQTKTLLDRITLFMWLRFTIINSLKSRTPNTGTESEGVQFLAPFYDWLVLKQVFEMFSHGLFLSQKLHKNFSVIKR